MTCAFFTGSALRIQDRPGDISYEVDRKTGVRKVSSSYGVCLYVRSLSLDGFRDQSVDYGFVFRHNAVSASFILLNAILSSEPQLQTTKFLAYPSFSRWLQLVLVDTWPVSFLKMVFDNIVEI